MKFTDVILVAGIILLTASLIWATFELDKEKTARKAQEEVINKISQERSNLFLQNKYCFEILDEIHSKE